MDNCHLELLAPGQLLLQGYHEAGTHSHIFVMFQSVETEVVGFHRDPYLLKGQPGCCKSTGQSPNQPVLPLCCYKKVLDFIIKKH